jgi:hypothetical protein
MGCEGGGCQREVNLPKMSCDACFQGVMGGGCQREVNLLRMSRHARFRGLLRWWWMQPSIVEDGGGGKEEPPLKTSVQTLIFEMYTCKIKLEHEN